MATSEKDKVGKGRFWFHGYDWCHVCGRRVDTWYLMIPDNAEHDKPLSGNEKRRWNLRVCRDCVASMLNVTDKVINDQE